MMFKFAAAAQSDLKPKIGEMSELEITRFNSFVVHIASLI